MFPGLQWGLNGFQGLSHCLSVLRVLSAFQVINGVYAFPSDSVGLRAFLGISAEPSLPQCDSAAHSLPLSLSGLLGFPGIQCGSWTFPCSQRGSGYSSSFQWETNLAQGLSGTHGHYQGLFFSALLKCASSVQCYSQNLSGAQCHSQGHGGTQSLPHSLIELRAFLR